MRQMSIEYKKNVMNNCVYICVNSKNMFLLLIICGLLTVSSCKKFTDVDPPSTGLSSSVVYSNNKSATAAVMSIYSQMISSSTKMASGQGSIGYLCGLAADELDNISSDQVKEAYYTNSLAAASYTDFWNELFSYIYEANSVIEGLSSQASAGLSVSVRQHLLGEALFIRAFCHFYGTNLFGNFPIVLTTDYRNNNIISRSQKDDVYKQIVIDLIAAKVDLSADYLSINDVSTTERIRPNKGAAGALLARTYLYTGNYEKAKLEADTLINNTAKYSLASLSGVFTKNSSEAIWQLQPNVSGVNTYDGYYYILTSAPGTGDYYVALSRRLVNSFDVSDQRLASWINSFVDGTDTFYYPNKYKIGTIDPSLPVKEYTMVLRLAEQYLIRAEARARLNDISGAEDDLNAIRGRAGLTDTVVNNADDLINEIVRQRRLELFTEWGQRWFDLKRLNKINDVMTVVTPEKGGTWNTDWALFPVPLSETMANHNLKQNDGY